MTLESFNEAIKLNKEVGEMQAAYDSWLHAETIHKVAGNMVGAKYINFVDLRLQVLKALQDQINFSLDKFSQL